MKYAGRILTAGILSAAMLGVGIGAAEPTPQTDADAKTKALEERVKALEKRVAELEGKADTTVPKRLSRQREQLNDIIEQMQREMMQNGGIFDNPRAFDDPFGDMAQPQTPKPRLGVMLDKVSDELKARFKNDVKEGAFVMTVVPSSPAAKAGVSVGDAVTSFDGKAITEPSTLIDAVKAAAKGTHELVVSRHGESLMLKVDLGNEETTRAEPQPFNNDLGNTTMHTELKVSALELPDSLAKDLKLSDDQRKKMDEVLSKHAKELSDEFNKGHTPARRGGALNFSINGDLTEMAKKHADNAAKDLAGVLNADQLKQWNDYRSTHSSVSFSQSMKTESRGGGLKPEHEEKGFSF